MSLQYIYNVDNKLIGLEYDMKMAEIFARYPKADKYSIRGVTIYRNQVKQSAIKREQTKLEE